MNVITGEGGEVKERSAHGPGKPVAIECAKKEDEASGESANRKESPRNGSQRRTERAGSCVGTGALSEMMAGFHSLRTAQRSKSEPERVIDAVVDASGERSLMRDLHRAESPRATQGDQVDRETA